MSKPIERLEQWEAELAEDGARRHYTAASRPLTPIPSKTVKRARDEGRLIVTFEVQISPERMAASPSWQRDATDVLRSLLGGMTFDALVKYLAKQGINVTSTTMEASK